MLTLRPAVAQDWPAVHALLAANHLPLDGAREHLNAYVLALHCDEVIGCVGLERYADVALLRSLAVSPDWQGQGVGGRLFDQIVINAGAHQLSALFLLTTTASRYFARRGFSTELRDAAPSALQASAEFQGACPAYATFMSMRLK